MSEYIDKDGVAYALQAGFLEGEIVILSDDKAAWKVTRKSMADASPVFRDMFANAVLGCREVNLPDAARKDLDIFIKAISNIPQISIYPVFTRTVPAVNLLLKYECAELARQLLYSSCTDLVDVELFDAFALASKVGDVQCGCRILLQGHCWYDFDADIPTAPPLAPNSLQRPWTPSDAAKVCPSWVWALSMAMMSIRMLKTEQELAFLKNDTQVFWTLVTGEFMRHMTR